MNDNISAQDVAEQVYVSPLHFQRGFLIMTGYSCLLYTSNISTTAAIVTAAAGVAVAKHGNRAASSKCGTADCLETLGVNLMLEPEKNAKVLKDTNLCLSLIHI